MRKGRETNVDRVSGAYPVDMPRRNPGFDKQRLPLGYDIHQPLPRLDHCSNRLHGQPDDLPINRSSNLGPFQLITGRLESFHRSLRLTASIRKSSANIRVELLATLQRTLPQFSNIALCPYQRSLRFRQTANHLGLPSLKIQQPDAGSISLGDKVADTD